ncbi:unnamed protein product [Prorocentrum cordatum]|uniref:Uncharacterized protein n=1 Tax=Prorocentrum cordatum TaxID=2364126 RepID=A0ABN9QKM7_9DINO|nr:unnamed protein product [Polarella glacialis]
MSRAGGGGAAARSARGDGRRGRAAWLCALPWFVVDLAAAEDCAETHDEECMQNKPRICREVWDTFEWMATDDAKKDWLAEHNLDGIMDTSHMPPEGKTFKQCCALDEGQRCCTTSILGEVCFVEELSMISAGGSSGVLLGVYAPFVLSMEELAPGYFVAFFRGGATMDHGSYWENASVVLPSAVNATGPASSTPASRYVFLGQEEDIPPPAATRMLTDNSTAELGGSKQMCRVDNGTNRCCNASSDDLGVYRCRTSFGTELSFDRVTQRFSARDGAVGVADVYDMLVAQVGSGRFACAFGGGRFVELTTISDDEWAAFASDEVIQVLRMTNNSGSPVTEPTNATMVMPASSPGDESEITNFGDAALTESTTDAAATGSTTDIMDDPIDVVLNDRGDESAMTNLHGAVVKEPANYSLNSSIEGTAIHVGHKYVRLPSKYSAVARSSNLAIDSVVAGIANHSGNESAAELALRTIHAFSNETGRRTNESGDATRSGPKPLPSSGTPSRRDLGASRRRQTPSRRDLGASRRRQTSSRRDLGASRRRQTPSRRDLGASRRRQTPSRRDLGASRRRQTPSRRWSLLG